MNKELNLKIEELYKWNGKLDITDDDGNIIETLYQRVVGDAKIQEIRILALKASRQLRKKLNDPESDEALAYLPFVGEKTKEEMIAELTMMKYADFRSQASLKVQEREVKPPKSDDLEAQEEYIEELEKARAEYEEQLSYEIEKLGEKYAEKLREQEYDQLFETYTKVLIDTICRAKMMEVFDEFSAYYGTFSDPKFKTLRFKSLEDFQNLSPRIKNLIMRNYKRLELGLDEVKK